MTSWAGYFREIEQDRIHGASQLYAQYLQILKSTLLKKSELSASDLESIVTSTKKLHPEMAPFHYLVRKFSELKAKGHSAVSREVVRGGLLELVSQLQTQRVQVREAILDAAREVIPSKGVIFCHSFSGSVLEVIKSISTRDTRVLISEGRPECEGAAFARAVEASRIRVTSFPDDAKLALLKSADVVVVGSDWVSESDFANKIGTLSLAMAAHQWKIPFYVVSDITKFIPSKYRPSQARHARKKGEVMPSANILFENTPNRLVTCFITDIGKMTPRKLAPYFETVWKI